MAERKFTRALSKQPAAQVRESVSQVVRQSTVLAKPQLVDPIDYETFVVKNQTVLNGDPQREMLLYPVDDVSHATLPRRYRTVTPVDPVKSGHVLPNACVAECVKSYTSNWNVVHYKYNCYSGSYLQLPRIPKPEYLEEQVYEVDTAADATDENVLTNGCEITKQGYLLKGTESGNDTFIASIATKSFKRRYAFLKREVDGSYVLEFHKDDKKNDPKFTICMEFCNDVIRSSKRGKFSFELKMQENQKSYIMAAENETELEDWLQKLKQIIYLNKQEENNRKFQPELRGDSPPSPSDMGTLKSLKHTRNPELMKYAKETDNSIAAARRDSRQNLYAIYPDMPKAPELVQEPEEPDAEPYKEQFGTRFLVRCEHIRFDLQVPGELDRGQLCQVEPYITTMALYDAKRGRKVSEDFRFDVNSQSMRNLLTQHWKRNVNGGDTVTNGVHSPKVTLTDLDIPEEWLAYPGQAVFTVTHPDPEIYLVIRIEKVLQGSISQAVEPYLKTPKTGDIRTGYKVQKNVRTCCQRLGHHRMPFAWTAKAVFKPYTLELDTYSEISAIYKQETSRLSEEDLLKCLAEWRKPDKKHRLTAVPGSIRICIEHLEKQIPNCLTSSFVPLRPFPLPPSYNATCEVEEFPSGTPADSHPHTSYLNHMYIMPKYLKYETQKSFFKARNIACCVELRDSDTDESVPLKCIYGRPGELLLTTQARCAVVHHSVNPVFYEEIKIEMPVHLHDKHHLLFRFLHVSCEQPKNNKRKDQQIETPVGYAWFPVLQNGMLNVEEQTVPVASHLPAGYLSCVPLGLGRGYSGPEIRWVDGQKPLFRFSLRLNSTIYTKDKHLHNFFAHSQKLLESRIASSDAESCKILKVTHQLSKVLKAMHAIDVSVLINFLPTILNQLFNLLASSISEDVALNIIRVVIHIIHILHENQKTDILHSYVKYVFLVDPSGTNSKTTTIHEELTKTLITTLRPAKTDFLVINKFLHHSWFFFQILIKSMAQHLLLSGKIKMHRHERFSSDFHFRMQNLLQGIMPHITPKFKELPMETKQANRSLAYFIKRCLTFMDRGFVFKLINFYVDKFNLGDPKVLQEYKFEFLQIVMSHEHYISLNLPLLRGGVRRGLQRNMKDEADRATDLEHEYRLSSEFCQNHFLVGILLQEVRVALNEVRDVRKIAVGVLRNLLAKHAFDDRYKNKSQQARIASLYLPFITIILENLNRLVYLETNNPVVPATPAKSSYAGSTSSNVSLHSTCSSQSSFASSASSSLAGIATPLTTQRFLLHRYTMGPEMAATPSPSKLDKHRRDSTYLSMISGQATFSQADIQNSNSSSSLNSSSSTLSACSQTGDKDVSAKEESEARHKGDGSIGHTRSQSVPVNPLRYDKLNPTEIKDLLICFLYIVNNVNEELLICWWQECSEIDILDFFQVFEICLHQFKYHGKKQIAFNRKAQNGVAPKSMTLPARMGPPLFANGGTRTMSSCSETASMEPTLDAESLYRALLDANMATEVGLITLDVLGLYCIHFKEQLLENLGDNAVMRTVFNIHISFLQVGQSEKLQQHVFASLRAFINKFQVALFQGSAVICGQFCFEILRCCNSRLSSTRNEACAILYLLMRSNYEFTGRQGLTRVHLQVIVSVSQLLGELPSLNCTRFQESLSIINNYANSDKAMQSSSFPSEVKDLTKRIRTVLMATMQMREHENDPEMLIDLQHSLANSYAATPELRKTWLESMAKIHTKNGDMSEAAFCYVHIAALVAEYLKQKGVCEGGCDLFSAVSPNIVRDESSIKEDSGMQDTQYTEDTLIDNLENSAVALDKSERYELMAGVYKIAIPMYEQQRDFESLSTSYKYLHNAYDKIIEANRSGKRLLGRFYRIAFFGQMYFEDDAGKEYIYKEPKVTSLPEISERLYKLFCEKFGKDVVKMIMDSNVVDQKDLDPKFAYVQVTHVTPYFEGIDLQNRVTEFERNNNINRFMFETPFTLDSKRPRGALEEQRKRKTILTTIYTFPYVKKRIAVFAKKIIELSPIEVAIDEMQTRVVELNEVVDLQPTDLKKLQLKLQGSISVQVNAGPLAYATAFLDDKCTAKYPANLVGQLKDVYRKFIIVCAKALDINGKLISSDQSEYQEAMKENFQELVIALSDMLHEKFLEDATSSSPNRNSLVVFNYISATQGSSSA